MTARAVASASNAARRASAELTPRTFRFAAYLAVSVAILSLPLFGGESASAPATVTAAATVESLDTASDDSAARGVPLARARDVLTQSRTPLTLTRESAPEIKSYTVEDGDTLLKIAADFSVTAETIAYNNGVTDARRIHSGDVYRIPPMDAAIYTVKDGDTVDRVAAYFKVDAKTIMDTNRLYFEPERFSRGKEILVPVGDSIFPNFELKDSVPMPVFRPAPASQPLAPRVSRLGWPVNGVITQYFWYGHTGVDVAAPYGAGIHASDAGTVSAVGWVAVGGLRVCVTHDWGMVTCYYHTSATYVSVGQHVDKTQVVAAIGMTGVTTGPHVHWEARYNGVLVNPLAW